jgi:hypothetical protein
MTEGPTEENVIDPTLPEVPAQPEDENPDEMVGEEVEDDGLGADGDDDTATAGEEA